MGSKGGEVDYDSLGLARGIFLKLYILEDVILLLCYLF